MALAAIAVGCSGQAFSGETTCASAECTAAAGSSASAGASASGGAVVIAGASSSSGSGGAVSAPSQGGAGAGGLPATGGAGGSGGVSTSGRGGAGGTGGVVIDPNGNAGTGGASSVCKDPPCAPTAPTGVELDRSLWRVSASNTYFPNTQAENAIDDDPESCWASGIGQTPGMWFLLDLSSKQHFFEVEVQTLPGSSDYARQLKLSASADGQHFSPLRTDITGEHDLKITFKAAQLARYLKLEVTKDTGGLWWRIDDLRVRQ